MPQDQRILDIIAAASEKRPADVDSIVDQLIGERIVDLIDQRRVDIRESFFAESAVNEDVEQIDELLGVRIGKTEAQKYPHMADALKYSSDHNRGPLGLPDMGHGYNFNRHKPDIENHPHFERAVEVCADDNEHHSLRQQYEHPTVQAIARDTGHSTRQVHDYCNKGSFYRRHGSLNYDKYAPTDGPGSPYHDRH